MKLVKGLSALAVSAVLLVGIPAALVFFAGNPFPSWDQLVASLTMPDYGGRFLVGTVLPLVGWVAWATFALGFLAEIPNQLAAVSPARRRGGRRRVQIPGLSVQQKTMGVLIAAVLAIFVPSTAFASTAPVEPAAPAVSVASVQLVQATVEPASEVSAQEVDVQTREVTRLESHTVQPGETLWGIAQDTLGDGQRYTEIVDASRSTVQPDGQQLTDPDVIQPGWNMSVPVTEIVEETAEPEVPQAAPDEVEDDAPEAGAQPPAQNDHLAPGETGSLGGSGSESQPLTDQQQAPVEADEEISDWFNLATIGGIGATLAAGLLGVLAWRRITQRRTRKPGQRAAAAATTVTATELELRAVESPRGVDAVDVVTRFLAVWCQDTGTPLPALHALRLDDQEVSLFLVEPSTLPEPFERASEDGLAWAIPLESIPELTRVPSAPYPSLVALGRDHNDGHMFVDLERLGALNVTAEDVALRDAALTAIAVELAVNSWSDDARVTLVGVGEGLPAALRTGRIRHIDDVDTLIRNLTGQAEAVTQSLDSLGVDSVDRARALDPEAPAWSPEVIIVGVELDDAARAQLEDLVARIPRVGITTISGGEVGSTWSLVISDAENAALEITDHGVSIPLIPQLVGEREAKELTALFDQATLDEPVGVGVEDEASIDDLPERQDSDDVLVPENTAPADAGEILVGESAEDLGPEQIPAVEETHDEDSAEVTVSLEPAAVTGPLAPVTSLRSDPYLRLLGSVELVGARGDLPMDAKRAAQSRSTMNRGKELVALLLLNPGLTHTEVSERMWPGKPTEGKRANSTRNSTISRIRRWLGHDDAGAPYLPEVIGSDYSLHAGIGCDWLDFQRLVGEDIYSAPTSDLVAALHLVKGQPFAGIPDRYYAWADLTRGRMIEQIGDVAHEVAARSLEDGQVRTGRMAAAIGRMVEPENEIHWRDSLRAEYQAGDFTAVDRLVGQLEEHVAQLEDEPSAETVALIDQIRSRQQLAS